MNEVFRLYQNYYNLCNLNAFATTVYRANQLWPTPAKVKECPSLQLFDKFKTWLCDKMPVSNLLKVRHQCRLFLALLLLRSQHVAKLRHC